MEKHTIGDLHQLQALPLSVKIKKTEYRIREWAGHYGKNGIFLAFSGGKDNGKKNKMESVATLTKKIAYIQEKNPNSSSGSFHNILQIKICLCHTGQ